jgi:hypothetical protein
MEFLQDFDFTLTHVPGHANTIVDLLSCRKDLNKGIDSQICVLLPLSPFLRQTLHPDINTIGKTYLKDNLDKRRKVL